MIDPIPALVPPPSGKSGGNNNSGYGGAGVGIKIPFADRRLATRIEANYAHGFSNGGSHQTGLAIGLAMAPVLSRPREQQQTLKVAVMTAAVVALVMGFFVVRHVQAYAVFFGRGDQLLESKDYQAALSQLKQAVALKPDDPLIQLELGYANDKTGDEANAILAYQRALQLEPDLPYPRTRLQELKHGQP